MEKKINIAELLKDCPAGMELDCTMYDDVTLYNIDDSPKREYPIQIETKNGYFLNLTKYGTYTDIDEAKCVIFPKGKKTWEGFQRPFKDGDVAISDMDDIHLLRTKDSSYCAYRKGRKRLPKFDSTITTNVTVVRLATEEEKQELFDAIKSNGYKWNEENKTLEKLIVPKFKVGNAIQDIDVYRVKITEVNIEDEYYEYESIIAKGIGSIPFSEQDNWELIPNKFDISALGPFDKVLVRGSDNGMWCASIFSHTWKYKYFCVDTWHNQCIPYEGNEHLLGTTDDCDEYFKNW